MYVVSRRQTILTTMHLHYTVDSLYKWEGWMVTREDDEAFGYIANQGDSLCPLGLNGGWEYQLGSGWEADDTLQVSCGDDSPTDGPGPTDGQDTTASDQPTVPGPGGMQPTIVAIKVRIKHVTPNIDSPSFRGRLYRVAMCSLSVVSLLTRSLTSASTPSPRTGSPTTTGWWGTSTWTGTGQRRARGSLRLMRTIRPSTR